MNITLTKETQKLLEERMREGDYQSPEDVIRVALQTLHTESLEGLDSETQAAIERGDAQGDRGEGMPIDGAFERLRRKTHGS